jgi:hypothetical protein
MIEKITEFCQKVMEGLPVEAEAINIQTIVKTATEESFGEGKRNITQANSCFGAGVFGADFI